MLALALLAFLTATYSVREHEQVLVTRFGEIVRVMEDPGIHVKAPLVDRVLRFDKRWLEWDGDPNQIPTRDKKYIWVDAYARWRISDPVLFYKRLRDEAGAQSRLDDIIDGEIRNVIASHDLIEVVRTSSREFERGELAEVGEADVENFGVRLGRGALRELVLDNIYSVIYPLSALPHYQVHYSLNEDTVLRHLARN